MIERPASDAWSNVPYDGINSYLYAAIPVDRSLSTGRDGDGRICAVRSKLPAWAQP
jgi:hypothetical protein